MKRWWRWFRTDADISDELRSHFEEITEEGVAQGLSLQEARRRARLQLGDSQTVLEKVREGDLRTVIESWWRDFTLGIRSLWRNPVFAATAILTLTVGIGANTVVFTLLYGLLLRSLPVHDAASLVRIGVASSTVDPSRASAIPYQMLLQLREQQKSFAEISAWLSWGVTLDSSDGAPLIATSAMVSGNAFETLGMNARLGRLLTRADDVRGGPAGGWPVVLSYAFWNSKFGGDPAVLGKEMKVSNVVVTVVGVAPENFKGVWPGSETQMYLPFEFNAILNAKDPNAPPMSLWWCNTIARLKPGVSVEAARAELATYGKELIEQFVPRSTLDRMQARDAYLWVSSARTGLPTFFGNVYSKPLYLMQGLVGIVLLLCCVNVAGLMMSKVYSRRQEFAVRTAIGAARWRLIRQYLTESFVIALAGAALGAAAAWFGTGYLLPYFRHPNEGIGLSIQPDRTILAVTGFFAALTTLLFGTLPAWRAGAADPGTLMKSRTAGGGRRRNFGRMLIPLQVALSFALVSIATLLSQSLIRLETEKTGFDLDHVTIQTAPWHFLGLTPEAKLELYRRMKARMEEQPGVESVSFTWFTPMTSYDATSAFQAVGKSADAPMDPKMTYNQVGPGYFQTMKTAILDGREFRDEEKTHDVCILNQSAAAYLFPRQHALGQYLRTTDEKAFPQPVSCRVIGLARDAKYANLHDAPPRTIYFPVRPETVRNRNLVFLINAPTKAQAMAAYRTARGELTPSVPFVLFVTLREQMDAALGSQRALALMSNFFAAMALFLSGLGLYGMLSSSVAQRTGEIGVRMALGAKRSRVLGMILAEALGLLAVGVAMGGVVFAATVRFVDGLLYGVSASDPLVLGAIAVVLAVTATVAGMVPALRAASVDPMQALRAE